jgi:Flp pilus assembly protein TadG
MDSANMNFLKRSKAILRQKGVAAVEMAGFMLLALPLLTSAVFLAIYMWHYTAITKASQNAAAFLSILPVHEMKSYATADQATAISRLIANDGTSDLLRDPQYRVQFACNMSFTETAQWEDCGAGEPSQVRVIVSMRLFDDIFQGMSTGDNGLLVRAEFIQPYVGI